MALGAESSRSYYITDAAQTRIRHRLFADCTRFPGLETHSPHIIGVIDTLESAVFPHLGKTFIASIYPAALRRNLLRRGHIPAQSSRSGSQAPLCILENVGEMAPSAVLAVVHASHKDAGTALSIHQQDSHGAQAG